VRGQQVGPEDAGSVLPQLQPALHFAIHCRTAFDQQIGAVGTPDLIGDKTLHRPGKLRIEGLLWQAVEDRPFGHDPLRMVHALDNRRHVEGDQRCSRVQPTTLTLGRLLSSESSMTRKLVKQPRRRTSDPMWCAMN